MSPGWLIAICVAGVILAPVMAILISAGLGYLVRYERCPSCGEKRLRTRQFYEATILVDGKRAPDAWGYYECEACGVRLKKGIRDAEYSRPPAEEWERETMGARGGRAQRG